MDTGSPSEWHSIRPWAPRLALHVREITSVSATFILSSPLSSADDSEVVNSNLEPPDSLSDSGSDNSAEEISEDPGTVSIQLISTALSKGLSVNVNGSAWQRVLIRIDDKVDEAVIIIYGLMPGRQYDIDLGLGLGLGDGERMRKMVVTESTHTFLTTGLSRLVDCLVDSERPGRDTNVDRETGDSASSGVHHGHLSTQSSSASATTVNLPSATSSTLPTPPQSPGPTSTSAHTNGHSPSQSHHTNTHSPLSLEAYHAQLQHTLSTLQTDRTTLSQSLKSARRDAHKADQAVRSQIDTLKRSSEKHTASEHRSKQKILALQEAVKRAQAATEDLEKELMVVRAELPDLRKERDRREGVWEGVRGNAEKVRRALEEEKEMGRKKVERVEGELAALGNRLERIGAKREKLEGSGSNSFGVSVNGEGGAEGAIGVKGSINELEEELGEVQREIESLERGEQFNEHPSAGDGYPYDTSSGGLEETGELGWDHDPRFPYFPQSFQKHSQQTSLQLQAQQMPLLSQLPSLIGRPPLAAVQRPGASHAHNSGGSCGPRDSLGDPFVYQSHSQSQSQTHAPSHRPNPSSSSTATSPSASSPNAMTLSGQAPPVEPGRGVAQALRGSFPPSFPLPGGVVGGGIADKARVTILQKPAGAGAPVPGSRKAANAAGKFGSAK